MVFQKKRLLASALVAIAAVGLAAPASLADDYSYVNAEHLNVRSMESVRGKIVATVDKGYRMTVLERLSNGWQRVLLENGQEGYVNGKYLSAEAPYYEKVSATRYAVKVANAFVRSDGLQKKIAVVQSGDQLEAVSDRIYFGIWVRVRIVDSANEGYEGRVGYISKRLIEAVEGYQIHESAEDEIAMEDESQATEEDVMEDESAEEDTMEEESVSEEIPAELNSAGEDDGSEDELLKLLEGL